MNGSHAEYAPSGELERSHLQDDRDGFQYEHAGHDEKHDFVAGDNSHRAQRSAKRQRTHIPHEHLGGIRVEPEKAQAGAGNGPAKYRQLPTAGNVRNVQVLGKIRVSRQVGDNTQGRTHHHRGQYCQAVQPVSQVDGVAGSDDDEVSERDKQPPHTPGKVLEKGYVQLGGYRRIKGEKEIEGSAKSRH